MTTPRDPALDRLCAAAAAIARREILFARILVRNGGAGWRKLDPATQWRAMLSADMLELVDAAVALELLDPAAVDLVEPSPADPSGDDPLRARTLQGAVDLAADLARKGRP